MKPFSQGLKLRGGQDKTASQPLRAVSGRIKGYPAALS